MREGEGSFCCHVACRPIFAANTVSHCNRRADGPYSNGWRESPPTKPANSYRSAVRSLASAIGPIREISATVAARPWRPHAIAWFRHRSFICANGRMPWNCRRPRIARTPTQRRRRRRARACDARPNSKANGPANVSARVARELRHGGPVRRCPSSPRECVRRIARRGLHRALGLMAKHAVAQ